jgi:hypothetical protein
MKKKYLLPILTSSLIFTTTNCKKINEDRETALLLGDWKITDVGGDLADADVFSDDSYDVVFEFKASGDFHFEMIEDDSYLYGVVGVWKWSDNSFTQVEMNFSGEDTNVKMTLSIDLLDGDNITGDLEYGYDSDKYNGSVELEKINKEK